MSAPKEHRPLARAADDDKGLHCDPSVTPPLPQSKPAAMDADTANAVFAYIAFKIGLVDRTGKWVGTSRKLAVHRRRPRSSKMRGRK